MTVCYFDISKFVDQQKKKGKGPISSEAVSKNKRTEKTKQKNGNEGIHIPQISRTRTLQSDGLMFLHDSP